MATTFPKAGPAGRTLYFDVREYGAAGLGLVDESEAVTEAVEECYAAGGGVVYLPRGRYLLADIPWYERVWFRGDGAGATVIVPAASDTETLFTGIATPEVLASDRFTYGGFYDIEFDGLDKDNGCRAISTYDLQTVRPAEVDSGLYAWLQQLHFERCVFKNLGFGIELWGDCRHVPIIGNRFLDCDVGIFVAHNHPNIRHNSIRECRVGIDVAAMLDCEIIGMTCSLNRYGLGGPRWIGRLSGDIDASQTTIPVDRTSESGPVTAGWFEIEGEKIAYTGKTATTYTGCTRGVFDTTPAAHLATEPLRRVNRFGTPMGRIDRTRVTDSIFYQNSVCGIMVGLQNQIIGNFIWSRGQGFIEDNDLPSGSCMEVRGSGNRIANNWLAHWNDSAALAIISGTSDTPSLGLNIEHNKITVDDGGRAIEKLYGTNDTIAVIIHGNDFTVGEPPADGRGGAAILVPDNVSGWFQAVYTDNRFYSAARHPDYLVKIEATFGNPGYLHTGNTYISIPVSGMSRAAYFAESERSVNQGNRFSNYGLTGTQADVMSLGLCDAETICRDNVGFRTENALEVTVAAGATQSAAISHGLGITPLARNFAFNFIGSPGASRVAWVSDITATTFRVNVDTAPGGAGTTVGVQITAARIAA